MTNHRVVGGCCGDFPEPEVDEGKKEEKACCHGGCVQCNRETGCGPGPVKEGSVEDASGKSGLLQKSETRAKEEYVLCAENGEYLFDAHDSRQDQNVVQMILDPRNLRQCPCLQCIRWQVTIFGLKRTEASYKFHKLYLNTIRIIVPWDSEKWKVETSEGVV